MTVAGSAENAAARLVTAATTLTPAALSNNWQRCRVTANFLHPQTTLSLRPTPWRVSVELQRGVTDEAMSKPVSQLLIPPSNRGFWLRVSRIPSDVAQRRLDGGDCLICRRGGARFRS